MIFSLVSRCFCFGNAYDFVFVFAAVCLFLLYALLFYVYCRVLPDVLSLMFFHVPPMGFLKKINYLAPLIKNFFKRDTLISSTIPSDLSTPDQRKIYENE